MTRERTNGAAVAAATVVYFALGALWYSPLLFSNLWLSLIGKSFDEVKAHGAAPYPIALICALSISYVLARVLKSFDANSALSGASIGCIAGLGMAAASAAPAYLFEGRPLALLAINAGCPVIAMTVAGAIIGAWPVRRVMR